MNPLALFAVPNADINCTWRNFDDTQTIYLTHSPQFNRISLSLSNSTMVQGVLPKGEPRPYGEAAAGSALYVFFNALLDNAEIAAIQWAAQGAVAWKSACFESKGDRYWVLAPTEDVVFAANTTLLFQLSNVQASREGMSPLQIELTGAEGLSGLRSRFSPAVQVLNPPVTANRTLNLNVGFAGGASVYTSEAAHELSNALCLYLTNPSPEPLVPGGFDSHERPPTFQLSLVFGDGPGALTRLSEAEAIQVNIRNSFGNVWEPVVKQRQGNYPSWLLRPSANGGGTVLGTGEQASIAFDLTGIVTQLPQGMTYAYLSFSNIPGYNDGYYALEIFKVDPVRIRSFTATPAAISNATGPQSASLDFTVENAGYISIGNSGFARPVSDQRLSGSVTVSVQSTTIYTLTATHAATGQHVSASVTVSVSPDILHVTPKGMIALWYGEADKVPAGWALCDGQNGTPDLRQRFVVGAGSQYGYQAGDKGEGLLRLSIDQLPAHDHAAVMQKNSNDDHHLEGKLHGFPNMKGDVQALIFPYGNTDYATGSFTSIRSYGGEHTHPLTIQKTGNGAPIQIVPRYFAVHYIMRVR